MKPAVAILDACVLFPPSLRDFLVWLSITGACRARWSDRIHDEWIRNVLISRPHVQKSSLERCRRLMDESVPDSLVTGFDALIPTLSLPDPDDRHVLAAAIHGGADCIVTFNLKDFPSESLSAYRVEAVHPDDFVSQLLETSPAPVCLAARHQRELLKNPPKSVAEHLGTLEVVGLVQTAALLRPYADSI
jgi:predicted nucleic acid-binding protein